ncbi:MAG: extracellular solute-binding protein [Chloroflexi bacterium]|nr:extracellular solute-binding protein [Chloroflexota bacterium]
MFDRSKSFVSRLMLLLTLLVLLAACGSAPASTGDTTGTTAGSASPGGSSPAVAADDPVTLSYLVDDSQTARDTADALVSAYTALHPNVTINVETRPQGTEGDNLVKTRLATGEMSDVFTYNSGSLLQALQPTNTLVDLTNEPFIANIVDSFLPTVSQNNQVFGVPTGTAQGGGILYNRKVYEELGLSVPKTWAEFEANNDKIKAAGKTPVLATYGDTWTSQLFVLADYHNVQQAMPTFAQDYTANKIKLAATPEAMKGFAYLQEGNQKGWYQQDYATMKFEQGLKLLADGDAVHFPMLSGTVATIAANSPDKVNDIGFFGIPGTDAAKHGATIWMPGGTYIPKTSQNIEAAKQFLGFIASKAGADAITAKIPPQGPYLIKETKLPDDALPAVKELAAYIDAGNATPALEFFSPVKGPNLEQLCVAVGSGQMAPADAAANYDEDVAKQAKQLGLPGW